MSTWNRRTPPHWFPGAIATEHGWENPVTHEVLVDIGGLLDEIPVPSIVGVYAVEHIPSLRFPWSMGRAVAQTRHPGDHVFIIVEFNEPVVVYNGTPFLNVDGGGIATYNPSISSGASLVFDYTWIGTEIDPIGTVPQITILFFDLNGSRVLSAATGLPADLSFINGIPPSYYYAANGIGEQALAVEMLLLGNGPNFNLGTSVPILVLFDHNVTVQGTPRIPFQINGNSYYFNYLQGNSTELTFTYVVGPNVVTPGSITFPFDSFNNAFGTIIDTVNPSDVVTLMPSRDSLGYINWSFNYTPPPPPPPPQPYDYGYGYYYAQSGIGENLLPIVINATARWTNTSLYNANLVTNDFVDITITFDEPIDEGIFQYAQLPIQVGSNTDHFILNGWHTNGGQATGMDLRWTVESNDYAAPGGVFGPPGVSIPSLTLTAPDPIAQLSLGTDLLDQDGNSIFESNGIGTWSVNYTPPPGPPPEPQPYSYDYYYALSGIGEDLINPLMITSAVVDGGPHLFTGDQVAVTLTWNNPVHLTGTPYVKGYIQPANILWIPPHNFTGPSTQMTFVYTIQSGDYADINNFILFQGFVFNTLVVDAYGQTSPSGIPPFTHNGNPVDFNTWTVNVPVGLTATQTGTARIQAYIPATQTGTARIQAYIPATQTGTARIQAYIPDNPGFSQAVMWQPHWNEHNVTTGYSMSIILYSADNPHIEAGAYIPMTIGGVPAQLTFSVTQSNYFSSFGYDFQAGDVGEVVIGNHVVGTTSLANNYFATLNYSAGDGGEPVPTPAFTVNVAQPPPP